MRLVDMPLLLGWILTCLPGCISQVEQGDTTVQVLRHRPKNTVKKFSDSISTNSISTNSAARKKPLISSKGERNITSEGSQTQPSSKINRVQKEYTSLKMQRNIYPSPNTKVAKETSKDVAPFPVVLMPEVQMWLDYFCTRGRLSMRDWLSRGQALRSRIMPALASQGVPKELFYLAMIESGFNNCAISKARAAGPWQFISATAKTYGLKINHWVDERKDPIKSTKAAAAYLKDLHNYFGDWYLALSAYNAGPGKVRFAISKLGTRDFWRIIKSSCWRKETRNYVPKLLAALIIGNHPKKYGFKIYPDDSYCLPKSVVKVPDLTRLHDLAYLVGVKPDLLKKWNPELMTSLTPPKSALQGDPYQLRIPLRFQYAAKRVLLKLKRSEFEDALKHEILPGDTLSKIARQYGISIQSLLKYNRRVTASKLRIGSSLTVPLPMSARTSRSEVKHRVGL